MPSYIRAIVNILSIDIVGSAIWFPLWWYTGGLCHISWLAGSALRYRWKSYAVGIWLKNFFVPMYGAYDIWSRLISILMRFVVFVGRFIAWGIEAILYVVGIFVWLAALPTIIWFVLTGFLAHP